MSSAIGKILNAATSKAASLAVRITMTLVEFSSDMVQAQTLGEDNLPNAELDHVFQLCGFRHVPIEGAEGVAVYIGGPNDRVIVASEYLAIDFDTVLKGMTRVFGAPSGLGLLISADGSAWMDGPVILLGPAASQPVARVGDTIVGITKSGEDVTGTITSGAPNVLA